MHYLGGKFRVAKKVVGYLESIRISEQIFLEPFVGGANIISRMNGFRIASDANTDLIAMYRALQDGWLPPQQVTENEYKDAKRDKSIDPALRAFIAVACSFSGKWFGGYARDPKSDRNYALNGYNSLLKLKPRIDGVLFYPNDYRYWEPFDALIYCDPPYENTTGFDALKGFNHIEFWDTMREWSQNNTVVISEYVAPDDFECVLEISTKTDIGNKNNEKISRIERLFRHENNT